MPRTITVDFEDVHVTIGRPTVADARARRAWAALLTEEERTPDALNYIFVASQMVGEARGLPFGKLTGTPDREALVAGIAAWEGLFEGLADTLVQAILDLRKDSLEKKDPS
jgi:hypothetical protein